MNTITLTKEQRETLLDALRNIHDDEGHFDIDIEIDSTLTINAQGNIYIDGYTWHDPMRLQPPEWIETERSADVELTAWLYNEEAEDSTECNIDRESEIEAERYLNAA